jgi:hypothetical protein
MWALLLVMNALNLREDLTPYLIFINENLFTKVIPSKEKTKTPLEHLQQCAVCDPAQ